MRTSLVAWLVCLLSAVLGQDAVAAEVRARGQLPHDTSLVFVMKNSRPTAAAVVGAGGERSVNVKVTFDPALKRALRRVENFLVVGERGFPNEGHDYVVFAISTPSVLQQGTGFCGSGTEDALLLLEWRPDAHMLVLRDRLVIQSCLTSMELQSDQGGDLHAVLKDVDDPSRISLSWLAHPKFGQSSRTVSVNVGKFKTEP